MTERSEAEMLHEIETANNGEGPDPIGTYSGEALQAILNALRERNDAHNGSTPRLRRRVLRVRPGLLSGPYSGCRSRLPPSATLRLRSTTRTPSDLLRCFILAECLGGGRVAPFQDSACFSVDRLMTTGSVLLAIHSLTPVTASASDRLSPALAAACSKS